MPSAWIDRSRREGRPLRFRVRYRLGGHASALCDGGSFKTLREAKSQRDVIAGEIAALRVPDLVLVAPAPALSVEAALRAWRESRRDVAPATRTSHESACKRAVELLGDTPVDALSASDVAAMVGAMHEAGLARSTISKSLTVLRFALDDLDVSPNPARDRRVKLPREERAEVDPPSAAVLEAALACAAPRYRLPLLVLEATGMRVGELESARWGDLDERGSRLRLSRVHTKTSRARFVPLPADLLDAIVALTPREDRDLDAPIFPHAEQARLRTDLGRACKAAGVPRFNLHDLRHRFISRRLHEGLPVHEVARAAGHARASVTLDTYAHVLVDDREVERAGLLG
jgi:integrase